MAETLAGFDRAVLDALRQLGSFDPEWYVTQYPDVAMLDMDPAEHFLWLGRRLGRVGSEKEAMRRKLYGSAREALLVPKGSRRAITHKLGAEDPVILRHKPLHTPSLAVAIHVFYEDLIDEVCQTLANIPGRFSAYFTVRDADFIPRIKAALAGYHVNCRVEFAIYGGKARNFAPLLLDFREQIRKHDLCLHLHTKKSLRTGEDQRDWRGHLFDHLAGSKELVATIIDKFGAEPRTGLVFATTWPEMPVWCHHWLSNAHRIDEVCERLSISDVPRRGLIDYPVGSMFWARTDAIAPLLEHPWKPEDFEDEPLPDDGSLAHVIERLFTGLCTACDYDYLEIDTEFETFRRNWSQKLLHEHAKSFGIANICIERSDVLSFDFYDTLFARKAMLPDDVHNYIGWRLQHDGLIDRELDFHPTRKKAEDIARRTLGKGDVDIDDIYHCFTQACAWSEPAIAEAKRLELQLEEICLVPREDVVALARAAHARGGRVILTSDSYMPRAFFERILARNGLSDVFDELYISSDTQMRKDRGDIWPHLIEKEIGSKQFFHFGDNEHSDLQVPERFGVNHFYLLNTSVLASLMGLGTSEDWRVSSPPWRDGLIHGPIIARFCANAFMRDEKPFRPLVLDNAHDIGFAVFGPIYFGYLTWIIAKFRKDEIGEAFFLAREGWFLLENYRYLRTLMGELGADLPEGHYLPVSRRAAMGAMAAADFEPEFIVRGATYIGTLGAFLKARLNYELGADHPLALEEIDTGADGEHVIELLEMLKAEIVAGSEPRLVRMARYMAQEGVGERHSAIIDVGYSGTIQSALQSITGHSLAGYYMATSRHIDDVVERGGTADGYFSDRMSQSVVHDFSLILEAALTAPHGQTIDYEDREDGSIAPVYGAAGTAQLHFDYLVVLNEGAKAYMADLLETYGPQVAMTTYSQRECDWGMRALIDGRIAPDEEFWHSLSVEDQFCGNDELSVATFYRF